MNRRYAWSIPLVLTMLVTGVVACFGAQDGQPRQSLKIGDQAPGWGKLEATDGKSYELSDFDAPVLVVVFACHHCPTVQAYEDRIVKLQADYKDKGVQLVVINPNNIYPLPRMKDRVKEKGYNFPYLIDASHEAGHIYGATNTPHFFVLDADRKVRYMGALDDHMHAEHAKKHHVREAIDALLAGNDPPVTKTNPVGCTVKYASSASYREQHK